MESRFFVIDHCLLGTSVINYCLLGMLLIIAPWACLSSVLGKS